MISLCLNFGEEEDTETLGSHKKHNGYKFLLLSLRLCAFAREYFSQRRKGAKKCKKIYSFLKLFTGFITAALIAWKLVVRIVIAIAEMPATTNTNGLIIIL